MEKFVIYSFEYFFTTSIFGIKQFFVGVIASVYGLKATDFNQT